AGQQQEQEQALREQLERSTEERQALQAELQQLRERQEELERLTSASEKQLLLIRDLFVQVSTARAQPEA
ncbi:MAG: hypothetical protein ACKOZW_08585, partial [Cyanobium sp.]